MDGETAERAVTIRTPDQRVRDIEITCQPTWTIADLKQHLSHIYPGNPGQDKQRLILAGKLLQDKSLLRDLLKSYEFKPIIHFVCTQTIPVPASDSESTAVHSTRSSISSPANPPVDPNPTPALPTLQIPDGNPRWNAHLTQLHMWHQQLEENQLAAIYQQHHLTQAVLRRAAEPNQEEPAEQPPAQQAAAPQPPAAAQDPEEQHDLLDVFYLIIRALFLLALAWTYASPAKFCFMAVLLFYIYLYQSGYIDLPSLFTRNSNEQAADGVNAAELSTVTVMRNALLSFFTSLMPSNENVVN